MGKLYDAKQKIEKTIADKGLNAHEVNGAISLKSGLIMVFIKPDTADDEAKLQKLRNAAKEVLNLAI